MWVKATFDLDVLRVCLQEWARELGAWRYTPKLSFDVPAMSVASFYEEPIVRQS